MCETKSNKRDLKETIYVTQNIIYMERAENNVYITLEKYCHVYE